MNPDNSTIGVLGAGIVGICSALSLIEAGFTVTLIDRDDPGQATSFGNAGVISPWSVVPQAMPGIWKEIPGMLLKPDGPASVSLKHTVKYLPWLLRFLKEATPERVKANSLAMHFLCQDSIVLYRKHLADTRFSHLVVDSMYVHAFRNEQQANLDSLGVQLRQAIGAHVEKIDAKTLHDLEPALSKNFKSALLIHSQARSLNPGKIGQVLTEKFLRMGGTLIKDHVKSLRPQNGRWDVHCKNQQLQFDKVVLSAGIWSADLLKTLNIKVPLAAERGYHIVYENPPVQLNHSVMDADHHVIASSMEPGIRIAGTAEFSDIQSLPNQKRTQSIQRIVGKLVPALQNHTPKTWMGIRPSFPDSLPIIQEFSEYPGLIGAFGHSHYGLMMAPKTGVVVAELAKGSRMNVDLSAYRADRFHS